MYYALKCLSPTAIKFADELGVAHTSNYNSFASDPRREGYYLYVVVDDDGYILFTNLLTLEKIREIGIPSFTIVD